MSFIERKRRDFVVQWIALKVLTLITSIFTVWAYFNPRETRGQIASAALLMGCSYVFLIRHLVYGCPAVDQEAMRQRWEHLQEARGAAEDV